MGFALLAGFFLHAEESISLRFFAPPIRGILTEDSQWDTLPTRLQVGAGPNAQTVRILRNGYSREIQVPKDRPIPLFASPAEPDATPRSLGDLRPIPKDWDRVLVLLASGIPDDADQLEHELIDFSQKTVPSDAHTFQNDLDNLVEIRIGPEKLFVEAGKRVSWEGEENRVRIMVMEIDGARGRRFTGAVHGSPRHGTLHLIQKNTASPRRINFRSLSMEAPTPEEPETTVPAEAKETEEP